MAHSSNSRNGGIKTLRPAMLGALGIVVASVCGGPPLLPQTLAANGKQPVVAASTATVAAANTSAGDVGRVVLHRLNRVEYNNTVRDLLGTKLRPADDFPADDHGYGFDNIAAVLSLPPTLFEMYDRAAEQLAREALLPLSSAKRILDVEAETLHGPGAAGDGAFIVSSNGSLTAKVELPRSGRYRLVVRLWGMQAGPDVVRAALGIRGGTRREFEVPNSSDHPAEHEFVLQAPGGEQQVEVSFLNDFYQPENKLDRNLAVDWVHVEGPLDEPLSMRSQLFICDPRTHGAPCVKKILSEFALRAWRRPASAEALQRLVDLPRRTVASSTGTTEALELGLRSILTSPRFLYRIELNEHRADTSVQRLDGYSLASRLSYFLWSSMPDQRLLKLAASGAIHEPAVVDAEVRRMLKDERSQALIDNFAGQWLYLRALDDHEVDRHLFPNFDPELRTALTGEVRRFFADFVHEDRDLTTLLTAKFTYLNDRLAQYYGIAGLKLGSELTRVELNGNERGGLLRMGAILAVTSMPNRTSPVKRGKWVLGQLLCAEPPPPPPGIPSLDEKKLSNGSLRELMAAHRANQRCRSCHLTMDPIGLALENYDAVGHYRERDAGGVIDASGQLPDGTQLSNTSDLVSHLAAAPAFARCLERQLLTYALGRGLDARDRPQLARLERAVQKSRFSFPTLAVAIALSPPFVMQPSLGRHDQ